MSRLPYTKHYGIPMIEKPTFDNRNRRFYSEAAWRDFLGKAIAIMDDDPTVTFCRICTDSKIYVGTGVAAARRCGVHHPGIDRRRVYTSRRNLTGGLPIVKRNARTTPHHPSPTLNVPFTLEDALRVLLEQRVSINPDNVLRLAKAVDALNEAMGFPAQHTSEGD